MLTLPAGPVAKYCDEYVCVCVRLRVCLSVREDISGTTRRAIFTDYFCACCLWPWLGPLHRRYDTLCTSVSWIASCFSSIVAV